MLFDLLSTSGNGKYAKLSQKKSSIELPTTMKIMQKETIQLWSIGDLDQTFTINIPQAYFDSEGIDKVSDIQFAGNFLMHKSLDKDFIISQLKEDKEFIKKKNEIGTEQSIVLIQPHNSISVIEELTKMLQEHQIKHVAITNFLPLLKKPREAVKFLCSLREKLPFDTILYLLSPVPHTFIPILAYLGIDVFNNGYARIASMEDIFLNQLGGTILDDLLEKTCVCEVCNSIPVNGYRKKLKAKNRELLIRHNSAIFQNKIRVVRQAIKKSALRSYLEKIIGSNVFTAVALRLIDSEWGDLFTARTSTFLDNSIYHITEYSYTRPAVKEFQRRIRERFRIKASKKVVVIFPCSARKPYSSSRSHKRFLSVLNSINSKKRNAIQELILTSPLGVIPRELELCYPAAHYDLPVTGFWNTEEKQITISQLSSVLRDAKRNKTVVIAHVSDEYIELCKGTEEQLGMNFIYTATDAKPTSHSALANLRKELEQHLEKLPQKKANESLELLQTLADYQFGLDIGSAIFQGNYRLRQRPKQNIRIMKDGTQKSVIKYNTGQVLITKETGRLLHEKKVYYLKFNGKELKGSTIYNIGVFEADPNIRPTDVIIILNESDELKAIGTAIASGRDMVTMTTGQAAKIRLKIKD